MAGQGNEVGKEETLDLYLVPLNFVDCANIYSNKCKYISDKFYGTFGNTKSGPHPRYSDDCSGRGVTIFSGEQEQ